MQTQLGGRLVSVTVSLEGNQYAYLVSYAEEANIHFAQAVREVLDKGMKYPNILERLGAAETELRDLKGVEYGREENPDSESGH